jgi:hypothetical protein
MHMFCTNAHVRLAVGVSTRRTSRIGWAWWNHNDASCGFSKNQLIRFCLTNQNHKYGELEQQYRLKMLFEHEG